MSPGDLVKNTHALSRFLNQLGIIIETEDPSWGTCNVRVMYPDGSTLWDSPRWLEKVNEGG